MGMSIPKFDTGLDNYYMAHSSSEAEDLAILCMTIDALKLPHPVRLAKIDAEGHDLAVLEGMRMSNFLIAAVRSCLSKTFPRKLAGFLAGFGYTMRKLPGSPSASFEVR